MGYSANDSMVRVDFFKPSGKWYTTEAVNFLWQPEGDIMEAFRKSLRQHMQNTPGRLSGMIAACLEPHHEMAHPLMLKEGW